MKRDELVELVRAAVSAAGYAFHSGEQHLINGTVRAYPAAWLLPPVVRSVSGRREGEVTRRITLHLMSLPSGGGAVPEPVWQKLESDALSLVRSLASSPAVCSVSGVGCAPACGSLTVHGEVSVSLSCDVTMWYYSA